MSTALIGFFGFLTVLCALLVLTLRQPMRAALSLVGLMINLAAIYASLGAHVVAVFQVLIYAGAVMVFMLYTIMLLDERDNSYRQVFSKMLIPAGLVAVLAVAAYGKLLFESTRGSAEAVSNELFRFSNFSQAFMKLYWFHFEIATVLLLVGILAAWTVLKEVSDE